MLNTELIKQLEQLKELEEQKIGNYDIKLKYLTLGHILKYNKQLGKISKDERSILTFIQEFTELSDEVISITKENNRVKLVDIPLQLSIPIVTEWIDLNFTKMDQMILGPIDQMLTKLTGKPISLKKLLESFSEVLSTAGTSKEAKS